MNINDRAKKILEERKKWYEINRCMHKILDVFEASNSMELKVEKVVLHLDDSEKITCYCAFFDDRLYRDSNQLLVVYNSLGITQNLVSSMEALENFLSKELGFKVFEHWINHPLEGFEISKTANDITIKINQNAICEKEKL